MFTYNNKDVNLNCIVLTLLYSFFISFTTFFFEIINILIYFNN